MKTRIKTIIKRLPLLAALLGVCLAMAQRNHSSNYQIIRIGNVDYAWFTYDGSGPENSASNYTSGQDSECEDGSTTCSILVEVSNGQPVLDASDVDSNGRITTGSHVSQATRKN